MSLQSERLQQLFSVAYSLLRLAVWENPTSQLLLAVHAATLREHLRLPEELSQYCFGALRHMFQDNKTLLHDLREADLRFFLELLHTDKRYL